MKNILRTAVALLAVRVDNAMASEAAAVVTSVLGTYIAQILGSDPWTWVFGGIGAAIVYVKKDSTSRLDAITNGIISVLLAGLVAPELAQYLGDKVSPMLTNPYPPAFLLSAAWPWILPSLEILIQASSKLTGLGGKSSGGGSQ